MIGHKKLWQKSPVGLTRMVPSALQPLGGHLHFISTTAVTPCTNVAFGERRCLRPSFHRPPPAPQLLERMAKDATFQPAVGLPPLRVSCTAPSPSVCCLIFEWEDCITWQLPEGGSVAKDGEERYPRGGIRYHHHHHYFQGNFPQNFQGISRHFNSF